MMSKLFDFDEDEKSASCADFIIGCDEAGRGPAAGGVWAAAVCFFDNTDKHLFLELNDSKQLSPKKREALYDIIKNNSFYSIQNISVEQIEKVNILNASLCAMKCAVLDCMAQVELKRKGKFQVLIDGNKLIKNFNYPQKFVIKGDSHSASIAAASILAKVERDRYMDEIDLEFPCYDWKNNKGYLTKAHIEAIRKYGTTKYHRMSFLSKVLDSSEQLRLL